MKKISLVRTSPETLRYLRSAVAAQSRGTVASTSLVCHQPRISPTQAVVWPSSLRCAGSQACSRRHFSHTKRRSDLPSNARTHYDFFPSTLPDGPPPSGSFSVDLKQLRNEFLKLQAAAHPDRHPPERKAAAEALSSRINEAYKTLQSPLLRAQYLLSLKGDNSSTDDAAKLGEGADDQTLLMEVLELREQIEEAETEEEIRKIKEENDVRIADSVKVLEEAFKKDDVAEAAKEAVKLRYWVNIDETLHAWEEGKPAPHLQH
ncbi:Fe-S protein assembly co-chaperone HscB [Verruconis gallopava]|uniref:Fe-S protein assembly co-chaperone HscB n=1 Tax=Verruconis gallopava TaxID=253628 RepID=A0A0D2B9N9_9PEZI|nr:Fe-S protein assembly co-chaperone HscB [Verruconis gallopava]KIW07944.1 Fe-S protein assembly co-chaperone HscB [Verruconis gallopava]